MGSTLPKPVATTVVERHSRKGFRIAVAEMNGFRSSMEDAHIAHLQKDWGFFGVFDGHGGTQCSKFIAKRMAEELTEKGCPKDDEAVKKLCIDLDAEFLNSRQPSGSTATMCIVHHPAGPGGKLRLRVVNAGDSRTLLGRRDGTIVDGGGTDQGLTVDHKPDHPDERARVERCGGRVETGMGGARVNGDLAVSRGFGDADHKKTGGPAPEDRPVTAVPELGFFEADPTDFLVLVCDGVSEGDFTNPEVIELIASILKETDDPGKAATAVCHKAVETRSRDNISCMIVLFDGVDPGKGPTVEYNAGPVNCKQKNFLTAYEAMAEKAGLTLAEALERRYALIKGERPQCPSDSTPATADPEELDIFGDPQGEPGSAARTAWFQEFATELLQDDAAEPSQDPEDALINGVGGPLGLMQLLQMQGRGGAPAGLANLLSNPEPIRRVRVAGLSVLQAKVNAHSELKWDPRMASFAGTEVAVYQDDDSDGTSEVSGAGMKAWLPTDCLLPLDA
jgi:serine/threonine protein phosphatase PrpC